MGTNGALALNDVSNSQLLFLDPPDGITSPDLQCLIQAWHQQAHIHVLDKTPSRLIIVLPRFHVVQGQIRKNKSALHITNNQTILFPHYENAYTISVQWLRYQIAALIVHEGAYPTSGRYRCVKGKTVGIPRTGPRPRDCEASADIYDKTATS